MLVDLLMTKVVPAVRKKLKGAKLINLQVDNAPARATGRAWLTAPSCRSCSTSPTRGCIELVELYEQLPQHVPQSPCTNLCDLGFFRSISSRLPKLIQ